MPAATNVKRVKNVRIERPFIVGSEAWPLDESNRKPDTPEDHTKGWKVYVRVPEGQPDITRWLKKVQFKIYQTYANPQRVVESPPFEVEETGWGGFNVEIRLFFAGEASQKAEYRTHFLQLEPYGDDAMRAKQEAEKMVRSEYLEVIEFNEPTEVFYDMLTSNDQWGTTGKKSAGKGRGKGKRESTSGADGATEGSVELMETTTPNNAFSKQLEQQILDMLRKAEKEVDAELATVLKDRQDIEKELKEVKGMPPKT